MSLYRLVLNLLPVGRPLGTKFICHYLWETIISIMTILRLIMIPFIDCNTCTKFKCLQIVGEIRAARNALVQITARLRSHLFRDISIPKDLLAQSNSASNHASSVSAVEPSSPVKNSPLEGYQGSDPSASVRHNTHAQPTTWQSKVHTFL